MIRVQSLRGFGAFCFAVFYYMAFIEYTVIPLMRLKKFNVFSYNVITRNYESVMWHPGTQFLAILWCTGILND